MSECFVCSRDHFGVSAHKNVGGNVGRSKACIITLHYLLVQPKFLKLKYMNYIPVTWAISRLQFRSRERRKKESGVGPIGEETVVKAVELAWLTLAAPSESNGLIRLWVD